MTRPLNINLQRTNLRYLLNVVKNEIKREINCHAVGTIQSFDPVTATATVSFNYKKVIKKATAITPDSTGYSDIVIDYPQLVRVPVMILNGGGAYTTYPISAGDECLLLFADRDIDSWLEAGSTQSPPNSERMHDLSDAIAFVGVKSVKNSIQSYSTTAVVTAFGRVVMTLTNLVASIIDRHGERLVPVGTGPIPTFSQTPPSGWLFMYGQTLGKAGSGAIDASDDYEDLFNILKYSYPNSAGESFSGGDKIIVPDFRGRGVFFKNDMGGNNSSIMTLTYTPNRSTLGGLVGEESHALTVAELPAHRHGIHNSNGGGGGGGDRTNLQLTDNANLGGVQTDPTGSNTPHNNIPPGIICNAMIKY